MQAKNHKPTQVFSFFLGFLFCHIVMVSVGFSSELKQTATSREDRIEKKESKIRGENSLFIQFEPFHVPIIRNNQPVGYVGMRIILEAENEEAASYLADQLPRIHDLIYKDIYLICDVIWETSYNPTLVSLKKRIDAICKKLIGVDLVKNVLIENLFMRRLSG
jgi:flagellar basal body-associated protein FliL